MKKVLYIVFVTVILFVLCVNTFSVMNKSFLGFRVYRIASGSMVPYLNINDLVVIKKSKNYKKNDVITYQSEYGEYITHRIIDINDEIITKGDANNVVDAGIKKESIIGKVIFRIKSIGSLNTIFSKPIAWAILFIVGTIATILIPDSKEKKKEKKEPSETRVSRYKYKYKNKK